MITLNYNGIIDIIVGIMLLFTASPLPSQVAHAHTVFLLFKGFGSVIDVIQLRWFGMPLFILAGAADILSAAILLTGNPPILADYKAILAFLLGLKGVRTFLSIMSM